MLKIGGEGRSNDGLGLQLDGHCLGEVERMFGHAVDLPAALFKPGLNQVSVVINNHCHMCWMSDNRQALATKFVDLEKHEPVLHGFESFPVPQVSNDKVCEN